MKKILAFAALMAGLLLTSCKEKEDPLNIIGTWSLKTVQTKAASMGGTSVDVYIVFNEDNTFSLYQKIGGAGRYTSFTGTWSLLETTLTGKYSDGKQWGSSYEVSQDKERTTLVLSSPGEEYSYAKASLPAELAAGN
ncbi:MAG: lipocalin family protein [Bacteroidales bacterium]|nr:lipocalin family protein [Bacteroidales bacterium]MBR4817341.1 lipocalin family protein [Bacteroidales bacterium]MBR5054799.1 lipocalin family protein [Bacteroidales bacterium]